MEEPHCENCQNIGYKKETTGKDFKVKQGETAFFLLFPEECGIMTVRFGKFSRWKMSGMHIVQHGKHRKWRELYGSDRIAPQ